MRSTARAIVVVPALLAIVWASLWAERWGRTESAVYEAGKEMATWRTEPGRETLGWIKAGLEQAASRDPKDASLQEMLGRLSLVGAHDETTADEAIARFTNALRQRPTSPYSWASLAEALYRKGDVGPHFEGVLQRAAETGPWEPEVQQTVADYGLAVWDDVSPSTRSAIERMVANGMARNAAEILQISARRGRLGVACAHLDPSKRIDPKWTRKCPSTEAT
jgi:predicted Zn-dependent protease